MSPLRLRALRASLVIIGLSMLGLLPLARLWPSGWRWAPDNGLYLQMIAGIYATLGVFLLRAARDPLQHLSLIWFTVWSSVVHGAIMAWQSIACPAHRSHLLGDVPALFLIALVLGALTPGTRSGPESSGDRSRSP